MNLAARLRDAATLAERAAVTRQHTGAARPVDVVFVARLQLIADSFRSAADTLDPPSPFGRRFRIRAYTLAPLYLIAIACFLLAVPDPSRPLVLAAGLTASEILPWAAVMTITALADRRTVRRLAAADDHSDDPRSTLADLRARAHTLSASLEPARLGSHRDAAGNLEAAHAWIDAAETALDRAPAG